MDRRWVFLFLMLHKPKPEGIAQAFIIAEDFIGNDPVALILGDNIFYGDGLPEKLQKAAQQTEGATILGYYVSDPERYGVIGFDKQGKPTSIIEKPRIPCLKLRRDWIYFYDNECH